MPMSNPVPELPRISDYVFHYADAVPDRIALLHGAVRITYAELASEVERTGRALMAAGIGKGDRVAMLCTPRPEFFIVLLATASIGAIWLGLHPRYRLAELRHVIGEAQPRIIVALTEIDGRDYRPDLAELRGGLDCIEHFVTMGPSMAGAGAMDSFLGRSTRVSREHFETARASVAASDTALIIFTSGSTGAPKGAMVRHYGLVRGALTEHEHWPSSHPVVLSNMPINHIAGAGMTTGYGLVTGGTVVFQERFDAGDCLRLIQQERITFWLQAPTMFQLAVNHPDFAASDISSLEYIIWAGAPMAEELVARLHRLGARLGTSFGMTELSTYITYSDADASYEQLAGSIGRPEPRFDLRLANAEGKPVAPGQQGEIQARGPWIMAGYFNRPVESAAAFTPDGWFRSGDTAVQRPDGQWKLVGRMQEMYKSGGYNIYPREIEIAVESHPAVAMCAVIGVPDTLYHEVGHAFVQLRPGQSISEAGLAAWCRERLANYKVPKTFTVLAELPRLAIGKLDKVSLRKSLDR